MLSLYIITWEGVVNKTAHDANSKCRKLSACRVYLEEVAHKRQCCFTLFGTNNPYLENWRFFCADRQTTTTTDGHDRLHYSLHMQGGGQPTAKLYVFTSENLKYQHFIVCVYARCTAEILSGVVNSMTFRNQHCIQILLTSKQNVKHIYA